MKNVDLKSSPMLGWMLRDGFTWDDRTLQIINSRRRAIGPALQVGSPRSAVIRAARRSYRALDGRNRRICSERAWVNDSLREHGLQLLANGETTAQAIGERSSDEPRTRNLDRAAVIAAARRSYRALDGRNRRICSERAWVNDSLREHGLQLLANDEASAQANGERSSDEPRTGEVERRMVIQQAKNHYVNLPGELQATESEVDWINKKLRENGLGKLTADELKEWNIWTG